MSRVDRNEAKPTSYVIPNLKKKKKSKKKKKKKILKKKKKPQKRNKTILLLFPIDLVMEIFF